MILFVVLAIAKVLFATQENTISPSAVASWLQNSTELLLVCTGFPSLNNWYVCTIRFPTAEQVMLIMPPLQKFSLLLFIVNTNLSGLTKGEIRKNLGIMLCWRQLVLLLFITIILCKCLTCFNYNEYCFWKIIILSKIFFEQLQDIFMKTKSLTSDLKKPESA